MANLVLCVENSKVNASYVFQASTAAPQSVAVELRKWLDSAVVKAVQSGMCVTFFVSIHQGGTGCDHEVSHA